ncbi:MAG: hypothetical protein JWP81_2898 [Ferruginibacter sp.]|nr:hypothetical protein [Ferruginibacter sp.]
MTINANTTIAAVLKECPEALEPIISIHPGFAKLRNPLLRKLMAGRASLSMAAKIGGCTVAHFYDKLAPLGFEIDAAKLPVKIAKMPLPAFFHTINPADMIELDVRPVIESGKDPLNIIVEKIATVQPGQVLKIINSFEPVPLILLLEKKGFTSYTDTVSDSLVETYFFKEQIVPAAQSSKTVNGSEGWQELMQKFKDHIQSIDVRDLAMPLPMVTILEALEVLPAGTALFVAHKKIPVFLLPELADRKFDYRIQEISEGEVNLLIFKA